MEGISIRGVGERAYSSNSKKKEREQKAECKSHLAYSRSPEGERKVPHAAPSSGWHWDTQWLWTTCLERDPAEALALSCS